VPAEELLPPPGDPARTEDPGQHTVTIQDPETLRDIEEIARRQESERPVPTRPSRRLSSSVDSEGAEAELPRAPRPNEARPIRPIEVPEDFVPAIERRSFAPYRKYWAAPAVCHTPLYFQDAVLERYGQGVEQATGPHVGRFLSYPLDDPRQSTQRNQIAQPFYSAGIFAAQIAMWPWNMIMDPPWEAQYDLGYYRPGDPIPPDTYYLPKLGTGPPLRGRKY
jgi:hypothetical protein